MNLLVQASPNDKPGAIGEAPSPCFHTGKNPPWMAKSPAAPMGDGPYERGGSRTIRIACNGWEDWPMASPRSGLTVH